MSRPRRFKALAALAVVTALVLALPGCGKQTVQESAQLLTMDTVMTLTVYGTDKAACQAVLQEGQDRLYDLDRRLSATGSDGSDIYALNHAGGRPVALTGDTAQLLGKALGRGQARGPDRGHRPAAGQGFGPGAGPWP